MKNFIIDTLTSGKQEIINALGALETVSRSEDGGEYRMDKDYSQVWITSSLTGKELENFLDKNGLSYTGVIEASLD
jgi:hypothetical protein